MDLQTKEVIKMIAEIQISAIIDIRDNGNKDLDIVQKYIEAKEDISEQINKLLAIYQRIKEYPCNILLLTEYQLLICSHILYRMEDEWNLKYPRGVFGAWQEIHKAMKKFHPEFTLTLV